MESYATVAMHDHNHRQPYRHIHKQHKIKKPNPKVILLCHNIYIKYKIQVKLSFC